jgi:hypothetical protein
MSNILAFCVNSLTHAIQQQKLVLKVIWRIYLDLRAFGSNELLWNVGG